VLGGREWRRRPGGEQAQRLFELARPRRQQKVYDRWVGFWEDFCAVGDRFHRYDPLQYTLAKWYLFAGYLWHYTEDRDLNKVRSALNRHFADNGRGRPLLGVDVSQVIKVWATEMDAKKRARGEQVGLHRVPCPESAVRNVIERGELAVGRVLAWAALLIVQLLGWFRAMTLAGFQPGDVWFDNAGNLNIRVRFMKMRKEMEAEPGLVLVPAARQGHWRARALDVLRRAFALCPGWECVLADRCTPSERGGSVAATLLSQQLRTLVPDADIPDGGMVGSHSWREMMALSAYRSGRHMLRCTEFGFWRKPDTMWASYIQPYLSFPRSPICEQIVDFL
jgi:hypothetical protein